MQKKTKNHHRSFISLVLAIGLGFSLLFNGCNTFQGAGEDIEELGEEMEDAAN